MQLGSIDSLTVILEANGKVNDANQLITNGTEFVNIMNDVSQVLEFLIRSISCTCLPKCSLYCKVLHSSKARTIGTGLALKFFNSDPLLFCHTSVTCTLNQGWGGHFRREADIFGQTHFLPSVSICVTTLHNSNSQKKFFCEMP